MSGENPQTPSARDVDVRELMAIMRVMQHDFLEMKEKVK
jgi:hypothetical protein